jgi:hypothetical protein
MWQPWEYPALLLTIWAFVFPAYRKRNVYLAMWGHVMLNCVGGIAMLGLVLR